MKHQTHIKSPLNYTGGKYKLMSQLDTHFPDNIDTFVDLFTGGANVAINVQAANYLAYDKNDSLIQLFDYFKHHTYASIEREIESIIAHYQLSDTTKNGYAFYGCESSSGLGKANSEAYKRLRKDYNEKKYHTFSKEMLFYTMLVFSFNNQIRFNKQNEFNMPVGKRDFNKNNRKNLKQFIEELHQKQITFACRDFLQLDIDSLGEDDFVYCDPPYLITTAAYNEQDGWTAKDEQALLTLLDTLHKKGVKFALSNVMEKDGSTNHLLKQWATNYTVHTMNMSYSNSNYHKADKKGTEKEVLVTNY